jgi:hypothetical protein
MTKYRARLHKVSQAMAENQALWLDAQTAPEAYLQKALRILCALIEEDKEVLSILDVEDFLDECRDCRK